MKNINFKRDVLPHLVAIIVFLLVVIIFFNPLFFENKDLSQHDILQGIGGGQELIDYRKETGKEGLWTNSMFGGMPGYLINTQWSGDLLLHLHRFMTFGLPAPARHIFISLISFYILLLAFKVRPYLAIAGAIAFGLNSFNMVGLLAGHVWRIVSIAFMPLVIAGVHLSFSKRTWIGLGLTAVGLGLHIRANHLQMTYYLLFILLFYFLIRLIYELQDKNLKPFILKSLLLFIPLILAIGSNSGKIWTILEYSKYSTRGQSELTVSDENLAGLDRDYTFQYSNSIFEPLTIAIPNIMGGASQETLGQGSNLAEVLEENGLSRKQISDQLKAVPTYWGKQPVTAPYYAGIIMVFLFILGLFVIEKPLRYWLITILVISIVLSWGDNFKALNYLIFDIIPGYNKFRSVTFTLVMAFIVIPLGGMIGLERFLNLPSEKRSRYLRLTIYITGTLLVSALIYSWIGSFKGPVDERLTNNVPQWFIQALREDRARLLRLDVIRNAFFMGITIWIIWSVTKKKISQLLAFILLIIFAGLDIGLVSARFIDKDDYQRNVQRSYFTPSAADKRMMPEENEQYRVLNLQNPFNESRTSFFFHSIGGYHGAKIQRYQDIIEHHLSNEINTFITKFRQGEDPFEQLNVLNMLNTRYFYFGEETEGVFENPFALGNAWFVSEIIPVDSPDEEINKLDELDPSDECVIDASKFEIDKLTFTKDGSIRLTEYKPNRLVYESESENEGFAVFSEIYYPVGWQAMINDEPAKFYRVNYILRGMIIPPGKNKIEFEFRPDSYYVGNSIMLFASLFTLLFFVSTAYLEIRKNNPEE